MSATAITARFHLSLAVADLDEARGFYADLLGCPTGRRGPGWIDFSFFGHQVTCSHHPERRKMIVLDPSGNAIEFKSYRDESRLYSSTMT